MKGVIASAVTFISGMAQRIRDLVNQPAELSALADELDGQQAALAAAIAENTETPAEAEA
jgi:prefoldin subunit 5